MKRPKDVFELKKGMKVYDAFKNRYGLISDIRETSAEWIEPFVKWEDAEKEEQLNMYLPHIKFVEEA